MEVLILMAVGALAGLGTVAAFDINKYLGGACLGAVAVIFLACTVFALAFYKED